MVLLFFLTGKFPLFQSNDDAEALLEIACIIGRLRTEKAATLHSRSFTTNIPSITPEGKPWREFVETLNPKLHDWPKSALCQDPYNMTEASSGGGSYAPPPSSSSPAAGAASCESHRASPSADVQDHETDVEQALDLLERLLHPESIKRITPRQALYHPFLRESEEGDDAFFPHPFGEGICGEWHFEDPVTEEFRVRIRTEEGETSVIPVMAGEGIAIGNEPCDFHREEDFFKSPDECIGQV